MSTKSSTFEHPDKCKKDDLAELWSEIRSGNPKALSALYHSSYSWLFNYGYKIIPRKTLIEDAIQELFLILWKQKGSICEARSVKSYLYCSLRRIILRRLKKQRNRTERNYIYDKNLINEVYNIEELIINFETTQEKKRQLTYAMQSLSKRQKEAIYLKFYNGLSNKEIAQVMDINKQSVYNHVSNAINKIQGFVQA